MTGKLTVGMHTAADTVIIPAYSSEVPRREEEDVEDITDIIEKAACIIK